LLRSSTHSEDDYVVGDRKSLEALEPVRSMMMVLDKDQRRHFSNDEICRNFFQKKKSI
jgi:hypothetical protein